MQISQKDTADPKLNVKRVDLSKNNYSDLSIGFKLCWLMKTLSKIQINPIHRDLLIALIAGFTMAVVLVSTVVIVLG